MTTYGVDRDGAGAGSGSSITPVLANGTTPLTADWNAGPHKITAQQLEGTASVTAPQLVGTTSVTAPQLVSTVAPGTPPLVVTSTTKVTNLNADSLDGLDSTAFVQVATVDAKGDLLVGSADDAITRLPAGADGTVPIALAAAPTGLAYLAALGGLVFIGGHLVASVASNALTIAVKTAAGTDPSSTSPVFVAFRSDTATNGAVTLVPITSATSITLASGSSLGCAANEYVRIHVGVLNNNGTPELFVWTASVLSGFVGTIRSFSEHLLVTTTAEGGGSATSARTFYSATARTSKAWRYAGFVEIICGTSPGVWSASPLLVHTCVQGTPRPGDVLNRSGLTSTSGSSTTSGSFTTVSGTSLTVTPSSRASRMLVTGGAAGYASANTGINLQLHVRIQRDSTVLGTHTVCGAASGAGGLRWDGTAMSMQVGDAPDTTSSVVYSFAHLASPSGYTVTTSNVTLQVAELQG